MLLDATSVQTPRACASPGLVIEFLRASRKVSDDNLRNRLGQVSCGQAVHEVYQEWQRRDSVLTYCKKLSGQLEAVRSAAELQDSQPQALSWLVEHSRDEIEFAKTPTDPRVDAYTSKIESNPMVTKDTFNWIASEEMAESIVRDSTWKTLVGRCGLDTPKYSP